MKPEPSESPAGGPFRRLGMDIVLYGLMGGLSKSAGLILLPFLTREFSPADYGILEIVITLTALLAIFISLNLESAIARFWVGWLRDARQREQLSAITCTVALWGLALVALIWWLSAPLAMFLLGERTRSSYIVIATICAVLQALCVIPQMVLRMQRKIGRYNILGFLQTALFVAITLLLVLRYDLGVFGAVVAMAVAQAVACLLGFLWLASFFRPNFSFHSMRESLSYSLPMLPAVIVTWVNKQVDRVLLLWLVGLGAVGIFGAAAKIALVVTAFVAFFQQAWVPLALSLVDTPGHNDFYRRALTYYAAGISLIGLVFVAFSKELMEIMAPGEYQAGYVVIPWLLGAQALHGSASITNLGMLVTKKTFGNSIAAWTGALLNVGLGLALIPKFGIWGAAIGMFIAELVFTSLLWRFSVRVASIRFDTGKVVVLFTNYLVASIATLGIYALVEGKALSLLLRSLVLIGACTIVGLLLYAEFRDRLGSSRAVLTRIFGKG